MTIIRLNDLERIVEVERAAFIPPLQASPEKITKRLSLGHVYLGLETDNKLVGTLAFKFSDFEIPRTFYEFSDGPSKGNAVFIYSLGILPEYRGRNTLELIDSALKFSGMSGMQYSVADGRMPSYNGSLEFHQERILQDPEFKKIIDGHITRGTTPSIEETKLDPNLAFLVRFVHGKPLKLIPNFMPEDKPSGGHRIILCKELK